MRYAAPLRRTDTAAVRSCHERILIDREGAISDLQFAQRSLTDTDFIDEDIRGLEQELGLISDLIRASINGNASSMITEEEYYAKHGELYARFERTEEKLNGLRQRREQMQNDAIERVTVYADERVVFHFKDRKDITELL
jgi:hypothetical protein